MPNHEVWANEVNVTYELKRTIQQQAATSLSWTVINQITFGKDKIVGGQNNTINATFKGVTTPMVVYMDLKQDVIVTSERSRFKFYNHPELPSLVPTHEFRKQHLQQALNNLLSSVNWVPENMFKICPFVVVTGENFATERGRRDITAEVQDYSQLEIVINGTDSLTAYWLDSFLKPTFKTKEKLTLQKKLKVGRYYEAFIERESVDVEFGSLGEGNNLTTLQFTESFTCKIPFFEINRLFFEEIIPVKGGQKLINKISRQQRYLWVIPGAIETVPRPYGETLPLFETNKSYFMMNRIVEIVRNPIDKKILWVEAEFKNVNLSKQKSGLAISNFIQNGAIGEPVAFPALDEHNKLVMSPDFLTYLPATDRQPFIFGLSLFCGSRLVGFEITDADEQLVGIGRPNIVQYHDPTLITYFKFFKPINTVLGFNKPPESDFYVPSLKMVAIRSQSSLRDVMRYLKSQVTPNPIQGFFEYAKNTDKTNTIDTNDLKKPFWSPNFFTGTDFEKFYDYQKSDWDVKTWNVSGNDAFVFVTPQIKDKNNRIIVKGGQKIKAIANNVFDWSLLKIKDLPHFIFFNSLLMKTVTNLPLTVTNNFALQDRIIGVFQNLLHLLTFGLAPAWHDRNLTAYPTFPAVAGLFPTGIFENYKNMFRYSTIGAEIRGISNFFLGAAGKLVEAKAGNTPPQPLTENMLPFDIFSANEENSVLFGAKNTTQAFAGSLTHLAEMECISLINPTVKKTVVVKLGHIGQVIYFKKPGSSEYDDPYVPLCNPAKFELVDRITLMGDYNRAINHYVKGYMVVSKYDCVVGGQAIQDKWFSRVLNQPDLSDNYTIYYDKFKTLANFNQNIRQIWNGRRTGNPLFDFKEHFSFPEDLKPITPDKKETYDINLADEEYKATFHVWWGDYKLELWKKMDVLPNSYFERTYLGWLDKDKPTARDTVRNKFEVPMPALSDPADQIIGISFNLKISTIGNLVLTSYQADACSSQWDFFKKTDTTSKEFVLFDSPLQFFFVRAASKVAVERTSYLQLHNQFSTGIIQQNKKSCGGSTYDPGPIRTYDFKSVVDVRCTFNFNFKFTFKIDYPNNIISLLESAELSETDAGNILMNGFGVVYQFDGGWPPSKAPTKEFNANVKFVNQNGTSDYPDFKMTFSNIKLKIG